MIANPILADIAAVSDVRTATSIGKSLLFEITSWLVVPVSLVAYALLIGFWALVYYSMEQLQTAILSGDTPLSISSLVLSLLQSIGSIITTMVWYLIATKVYFRARRWAKRYRLSARNTLGRDPRHPMLYLRSFSEEHQENKKRRSLKTGEEDLAYTLRSFGPLVALGNPVDDISPLGCTRIYLRDNAWQENVRRLMLSSQLIVIEAGTSKGLLWEMEVILREGDPRKLLVSFLSWQDLDENVRESKYADFKNQIERTINESNTNIRPSFPARVDDAKFMVFTHDWKPELVRLGKWKKRLFYFSKSILIAETLRPILRSRNLKLNRWKRNIYLLYVCWIASSPFIIVAPTLVTVVAIWLHSIVFPNSSLGEAFFVFAAVIYVVGLVLFIVGVLILFQWLGASILAFVFRPLKKAIQLMWRNSFSPLLRDIFS
jgi:hypothetical protein